MGQTIVDRWAEVAIPAPPVLVPVTVKPARSALLVLDMLAVNCVPEKRPSCVRSIAPVEALLKRARAAGMLVIYSAGQAGSVVPPDPVAPLKPLAGEPMVRAGADKFLHSDLEQILKQHGIDTVIITGTSAEGAVLYTASGASGRGFQVVVPVDGLSAAQNFAELYTVWHLQHAPASITSRIQVTSSDQIAIEQARPDKGRMP
ncbi:cysteine hydrolase [Novosphingobium umbonatum]|nr:cysteine hydrolase [Novosphingobium umbonatum]